MKQAKSHPIDVGNISPAVLEKCSGPGQFERFDALVSRVLSVPREKIMERREDYAFHSAINPSRPGPKRGTGRGIKRKPAFPAPDVQPPA